MSSVQKYRGKKNKTKNQTKFSRWKCTESFCTELKNRARTAVFYRHFTVTDVFGKYERNKLEQ